MLAPFFEKALESRIKICLCGKRCNRCYSRLENSCMYHVDIQNSKLSNQNSWLTNILNKVRRPVPIIQSLKFPFSTRLSYDHPAFTFVMNGIRQTKPEVRKLSTVTVGVHCSCCENEVYIEAIID